MACMPQHYHAVTLWHAHMLWLPVCNCKRLVICHGLRKTPEFGPGMYMLQLCVGCSDLNGWRGGVAVTACIHATTLSVGVTPNCAELFTAVSMGSVTMQWCQISCGASSANPEAIQQSQWHVTLHGTESWCCICGMSAIFLQPSTCAWK